MKSILFALLMVAVIAVVGAGIYASLADRPEVEENFGGTPIIKEVTPLDAVTATTTSDAIDIKGAKKVTLFLDQDFVGGSGYIATTTYTVTVSTDDTTYVSYNKLVDNVANTNAQTLTRVASKVAETGTDYILSMDLEHDAFSSFKVVATTVTPNPLASTTVTAKALIEF